MRLTLLIFLLFVLQPAFTDSTIYRCTTGDLSIEYRSSPCDSGISEKIEIQTRPTGWIKPDTPTSVPSKNKKRPKKTKSLVEATTVDRACWRAKQRVEQIQWELRKGYKPAKGERLRRRRREQEAYLREFCR